MTGFAVDFAKKLLEKDEFIIITHKRPDGDTVGSASALCDVLRRCGKTAYLLKNADAGSRLAPYIEKREAPHGFVPQVCAAVDVSAYTQLQSEAEPYAGRLDFLIDHHIGNAVAAGCRLIDENAAATGELVCLVAKELAGNMDRQTAEMVYLAVATDTGCFKYQNTRALSHRIAAECIEAGADTSAINTAFFDTKSTARIELEREMFNSLRMYKNGKIALMHVPMDLFERTGATQDDTENLAALPRQIEGVDAGLVCYGQENGSMRFSLRTSNAVDAAAFCARFGGGGHARAAGCTLDGPFEAAAESIVAALAVVLQ